jgi:MFS family permease
VFPFDALIDRFQPKRPTPPRAVAGYRFLIGSSLLGLGISLLAVIITAVVGQWWNCAIVATFGAGLALLLAFARAGASLAALSNGAFCLLAAFFASAALLTTQLHWSQLQWLALLPIVAMLNEGDHLHPSRRQRAKRLLVGAGIAMILAGVVVMANRQGWTLGEAEVPQGFLSDISSLSDSLLFIASVAGLLWVHHEAAHRAHEELLLLQSMLQVCAWCRRIHDADAGWIPMEQFMARQASARLTHGICPDCVRKHP